MRKVWQLVAVVTVSLTMLGCNSSVGTSTAPEGEGLKSTEPGAIDAAAQVTPPEEAGAGGAAATTTETPAPQ